MYEEEGSRFPDLLEKADVATNAQIAARYTAEFERYIGIGPVQAGV